MKKILLSPLLYLFIVICIFYSPVFLQGKLPIPADTIVSLYHPYRDLYARTNPRGVPYKNSLITDPVRQQYPWRFIAIEQLKQLKLPTWNPYSMTGTPLIGNFQSGVFYPLNFLFFFLPFSLAWTILIMSQTFLGAFFMYLYLQNKKLHPFAIFFGSISFAFSGFAIAWLEWGTIFQTILWLPLMLFAIDKLVTERNRFYPWGILFLFALIASCFAGHLQSFFYVLLMFGAYLLYTFFGIKPDMKKNVVLLSSLIIFMLVAVIQLLLTFQFILESARNVDQIDAWQRIGWFIPWQNVIQFLIPDFFGNPATGNYFGVWNYGEFIGYIGVIPVLFAIYAVFFFRDKTIRFFTSSLCISLLFAFPTILAKLPFEFHIPYLATAQPTRLLGIADFSLAVISAFGLNNYIAKRQKTIFYPFLILAVLFGISFFVIYKHTPVGNQGIIKHNSLLSIALFIFALSFVIVNAVSKNKRLFLILTICLLLVTSFDLIRFSQKFTPFTPAAYLYPETRSIQFLLNHAGNYRVMSLDSRILPPNMSLVYNLQTIEGYDPLYLQRYGEFIAALQRGKPDISTPFGFNRIITPHTADSKLIDLLGVKYVLSLSDITSPKLTKVFQEGETRVYENKNVIPRVFFVRMLVAESNISQKQGSMNTLFKKSFNPMMDAAVEGLYTRDEENQKVYSQGTAELIKYSPEEVIIKTKNEGKGFLILTDAYYPTWSATISDANMANLSGGNPTHIFRTDYLFRGVFIPAGEWIVRFRNTLFHNGDRYTSD